MHSIKSIFAASRSWLHFLLVMAFVMASATAGEADDAATTIYIVRHAEKLDNSPDSPLAPKGFERAKELAHILQDAGLTAIYVSNRLRTQQTAAPIAEATGIKPNLRETSDAIVKDILDNNTGGHILVVGHSDTVAKIAAGLGAGGVPELKLSQYDRLFIVHRVGDKAYVHFLRYGAPTD